MLDHDREELEQITPYVLSRPKVVKMAGCWKQDDPDGYLLSCPCDSLFPSQSSELSQFPKHLQSQMKHGLRKQYIISEC